MFDILSDIVEGTVDTVGDVVNDVSETTKKMLNGALPDASTVQGLLDTGMSLAEMSDVTGIAIDVLAGILES